MSGLDFDAAVDMMMRAAREGVRDAAELVRRDSDQLIPVDTGEFRGSSRVIMNGQQEALISYSAPYAVIVHEKVEIHHQNGQAKFLEAALLSNTGAAAQAIADTIRRSGA